MPDARPFTQVLQEQRRGTLHDEISEALAEVVKGALEHGKQGTLQLSLKIKPSGEGTVQIYDELKVLVPKGDTLPSIFFADENGNVSRQDPRQQEKQAEAGLHPVSEAVAS